MLPLTDVDWEICRESTFRDALPSLIHEIGEDPAFYFIDPYGWKGAEFDLVERALAGPRKEGLINFMYDAINEWAGVARRVVNEGASDSKTLSLMEGLSDFFGSSEWVDIVIQDLGPQEKERLLLRLYASRLRQGGAYAWPFRNKYPGKDRTIYYLIHATKNVTGLKIMKDLMVNEDLAPPTLFEELDFEDFKAELRRRLGGGTPVPEDELLAYVLQETGYLDSHFKRALKELKAQREQATQPKRRTFWRSSGP